MINILLNGRISLAGPKLHKFHQFYRYLLRVSDTPTENQYICEYFGQDAAQFNRAIVIVMILVFITVAFTLRSTCNVVSRDKLVDS